MNCHIAVNPLRRLSPKPPTERFLGIALVAFTVVSIAVGYGSDARAGTQPQTASMPWTSEPPDSAPFVDWGHPGKRLLRVGSTHGDGTHTVQVTFSVTQSQNGKRNKGKWERWKLECYDRDGQHCWLDRLRIQVPVLDQAGPLLWEEQLNTVDHTINNLRMDWRSGLISFSFSLTPQRPDAAPPTQVEILVSQDNGSLFLKSFRAVGRGRDEGDNLVSFDYAIADETVTLNVPLVMPGLRSVGQKRWDDMFRALSVGDQQVWRGLAAHPEQFLLDTSTALNRAKAALPQVDWSASTDLTPEQAGAVDRFIVEANLNAFRERLARSAMTAEGQQKIVAYVAAQAKPSKRVAR